MRRVSKDELLEICWAGDTMRMKGVDLVLNVILTHRRWQRVEHEVIIKLRHTTPRDLNISKQSYGR